MASSYHQSKNIKVDAVTIFKNRKKIYCVCHQPFRSLLVCGKSLIVQQRTSQGDMTDLLDSDNIGMHCSFQVNYIIYYIIWAKLGRDLLYLPDPCPCLSKPSDLGQIRRSFLFFLKTLIYFSRRNSLHFQFFLTPSPNFNQPHKSEVFRVNMSLTTKAVLALSFLWYWNSWTLFVQIWIEY